MRAGPFLVTGGTAGRDYAFRPEEQRLVVLSGTPLTLANSEPGATDQTIFVEKDASARLTLAGVRISTNSELHAALHVAKGSAGDVSILLAEGSENHLESGPGRAGLEKAGTPAR